MQFNCRRGATVHFSCDEGYELQGSKSISCLRVTDSYVGWSDDRPICRGKDWRVGWSSAQVCGGGCPSVTFVFSYSGALMLMCLPVSALSFCVGFFSVSLTQYSLLYCDWTDFDLWPAFFCFLLFSHAGIVLPISHVFLTSNHFVTGRKSSQAPCTAFPPMLLSFSFQPQWNQSRLMVDLIGSIIGSIDGYLICEMYSLKQDRIFLLKLGGNVRLELKSKKILNPI